MLSDLDQRQAMDVENDISANSAAALSTPFSIPTDTTTSKNLSSIFKISFYIAILLLLSVTSYYSYLSYQQSDKNVKPHVAPNKRTVKIIPPKTVRYNKVKNTNSSKPDKPKAKKQAPLVSNTLTALPPAVDHKTYQIDNEAKAEEITEPVSNDIASVKKQPRQLSNTQQAELAYQKGYQLLRQNKIYSAEVKLLLALEHNVKHIKAREMLVGLYLKTGRKVEAEVLLNKGLLHLPTYSNFAKLVARLLLDNNQVDKAVKTLLNHRPAITADPNFYALLAASYQRQNNHAAAANTYVQLLKINPREGIWWVGMGISLEALDKNQQALEAYEKARQTGTLNTRITNYSSQRLKILNTSADAQ